MEKVIWKFQLQIIDRQPVEMPEGSQVLSVDEQNGGICLWVLCDPEKALEEKIFHIHGTGNTVDDNVTGDFIGTVQTHSGKLVWHVFHEKA